MTRIWRKRLLLGKAAAEVALAVPILGFGVSHTATELGGVFPATTMMLVGVFVLIDSFASIEKALQRGEG
jgi:hypothetical protein